MKDNKVSLTIRLTPELMAYVKKHGASNYSHFVSELIRKEALNNVQDDVVARLKQAILNDHNFNESIDDKVDRRYRLLQMD